MQKPTSLYLPTVPLNKQLPGVYRANKYPEFRSRPGKRDSREKCTAPLCPHSALTAVKLCNEQKNQQHEKQTRLRRRAEQLGPNTYSSPPSHPSFSFCWEMLEKKKELGDISFLIFQEMENL